MSEENLPVGIDGKWSRRDFLQRMTLAGGALTLVPNLLSAAASAMPVPMRKFGAHDQTVSSLCLGGHTLGKASSLEEAVRIAHEAIDRGVTFFDNSWDYHGGRSEEWMGKAIYDRRDKVFLMTKVCSTHRGDGSKQTAMDMLDESLKRLQTDHLDLWMVHAVSEKKHVEDSYREDGVNEALVEAKKAGKIRYTGYTGHTTPELLVEMVERGFPYDACLFPLNTYDRWQGGGRYQEILLPKLLERNVAPLAMKTLSGNAAPVNEGDITVEEALRYALSFPVASVVNGVETIDQLRMNSRIVADFKPMDPDEMAALEERSAASRREAYAYYRHPDYEDGGNMVG